MTRTIWVRVFLAAAAPVLLSPMFGQSKGGGAPTGTPTGTSTGTPSTGTATPGRGTPTTTTTPSTTQQPTVTMPQPIFISGRVQMEDGAAPPESVVIQTVCNGQPHAEGYTDAKGYFGIELGSNRGIIPDASEFSVANTNPNAGFGSSGGSSSLSNSLNSPERKYMGCDLQAKLSGYRSQSIALAGRRPMDDPNIGVILLHKLGASGEEGRTVSAVSLAAPKDAKKAYEKGLDQLKKQKFADAQASFEKALEVYPGYASAWFELGRLRVAENQFDIARGSFDRAIKADPKFVPPYLQISLLELESKRWQELADVTEKIVKLDPFDYPQAYFFNSVANFNLRNLEASEKSALEAERLDTRHQFAKVQHLLGLIAADRKDWPGAATRFKDYIRLAPKASDVDQVKSQLSQVEKIQAQALVSKERQ